MTPKQKTLINKLAQEILWWKQGQVTQKTIEEFVRHEVLGLLPDQENRLINELVKILKLIQEV